METLFIDKEIKYTGTQLSPHWIYKNFNLLGDAIVSFAGEVDVKLDEMVDIEDVINSEPIYSKRMLNFIIERFNTPLEEMVYCQRLFMAIIKEELEKYSYPIIRKGDDLYYKNRKLSVSIASKSITSSLIHTGLNIIKEGALIEASDLSEIGIRDIEEFAKNIMEKFKQETLDIKKAACKVRGISE